METHGVIAIHVMAKFKFKPKIVEIRNLYINLVVN